MLGWRIQSGAPPVGVDLSASMARILTLSRGRGGLSVSGAAQFDLPGDEPGSDAWIGAVTEGIRRRCQSGLRGRACVIGIDDRSLCRVRSARLPVMTDEETESALGLDAAERLGFAEHEPAEIGWFRAGEVRQGRETFEEVVLVGAASEVLERLVFAIAETGLRPAAVEPRFLACARAFSRSYRRAADAKVVRVVVDIGERGTTLLVLRGQDVAFHKSLEVGCADLTRAAAERLGIEEQTVEDLRRQRQRAAFGHGEPVEARVDRALFEGVRPILGDIAHEATLCMRYFGVTFRGGKPTACVLSGPGGAEPGLREMMSESLHVESRVGDPLEGMGCDGVAAVRSCAAEWSSAAGLALRGRTSRGRREDRAARFERRGERSESQDEAGARAA